MATGSVRQQKLVSTAFSKSSGAEPGRCAPGPRRGPPGLAGGHGLPAPPGYAHKQAAGGHQLVDVGAGAGEDDAGAAQLSVDLLRLGLQGFKGSAAPHDEDAQAGVVPAQGGGQFHQLPGGVHRLRVQAADVGDDGAVPQVELPADGLPGEGGGEFVRVDAVDGQGDVLLGDVILADQIVPDVLGHGQGALPQLDSRRRAPLT